LNKLGAINHTLLSIEAIRRRKIPIIGIIFNHQPKEDKTILEDNINIIKALTNQRVLGSISWLNDEERLYKLFIPIGKRILTYLT
jgi:dethiobiotin synthetase